MKRTHLLPLLLLGAATVFPAVSHAGEQLIPGGSLIQCTVSEPRLNSKTENIGDPVLCGVSHVELYGRSVFPYGSYMEGRFADFKDPGHFVGKGWMELDFDRLIVGNTVIPVSAKVVYVPKYPVDKEGRIHGTGHPVRDAVEWAIPVLWPIDLINLPRRGPRPTLKPETRLTLKVMDDFVIPDMSTPYPQNPGLLSRQAPEPYPTPQYQQPPPQPYYPAPTQYRYAPPPPPAMVYQPVVYSYAPPPGAMFVSAPMLFGYMAPQIMAPQIVVPQVVVPAPVMPTAYGYVPYGAPVARASYYPPYGAY